MDNDKVNSINSHEEFKEPINQDIMIIINEFLEMIFNNWTYDPWLDVMTTNKMTEELANEIEEFEYAETKKHKAEELGDILWDIFNLVYVFSKEYDIPIEKPFQIIVKKMKHRKPYIFERKYVSLEEAKKIWKKVKQMEKEGKINLHE